MPSNSPVVVDSNTDTETPTDTNTNTETNNDTDTTTPTDDGDSTTDPVDPSIYDQASEIADKTDDWLADNEWCIGIVYLVAGPLIALFGTAWFPYITAALVAIFTIGFSTFGAMELGWTETVGGSVGVLLGALALGILAGCLVRRSVWLMVGLLGGMAGAYFGGWLCLLIFASAGSPFQMYMIAPWLFYLFVIAFGAIGMCIACKKGVPMVMICTAFAGSYLFMRSWTLFFPGTWPSEKEIFGGEADYSDYGYMIWVYLCIFAASFAGALVFQCKVYTHVHPELDAYKDQ